MSNVINWNRARLSRFREAYKAALDSKQETFVFEGHDFVIGYAKYLIEFLDDEFKTGATP